jgi:hypothetical protein
VNTLERDLLHLVVKLMERNMADFTELKASVVELEAKVDAYVNRPVPEPINDQPQVDEINAQIRALLGRIPS